MPMPLGAANGAVRAAQAIRGSARPRKSNALLIVAFVIYSQRISFSASNPDLLCMIVSLLEPRSLSWSVRAACKYFQSPIYFLIHLKIQAASYSIPPPGRNSKYDSRPLNFLRAAQRPRFCSMGISSPLFPLGDNIPALVPRG